jgi:hypothetical protein
MTETAALRLDERTPAKRNFRARSWARTKRLRHRAIKFDPVTYHATETLNDGRKVEIRAQQPGDQLEAARLSAQALFLRAPAPATRTQQAAGLGDRHEVEARRDLRGARRSRHGRRHEASHAAARPAPLSHRGAASAERARAPRHLFLAQHNRCLARVVQGRETRSRRSSVTVKMNRSAEMAALIVGAPRMHLKAARSSDVAVPPSKAANVLTCRTSSCTFSLETTRCKPLTILRALSKENDKRQARAARRQSPRFDADQCRRRLATYPTRRRERAVCAPVIGAGRC